MPHRDMVCWLDLLHGLRTNRIDEDVRHACIAILKELSILSFEDWRSSWGCLYICYVRWGCLMRPTAGGGLLLGGCNDGWKVHFNSQRTPLPALMVTAAAPARVRVRPDDKMFHQLPPTTYNSPPTTHYPPPTAHHPQLTTRPLTITNQKPQTTNQPIMVDPKTQSVLCKVFKLLSWAPSYLLNSPTHKHVNRVIWLFLLHPCRFLRKVAVQFLSLVVDAFSCWVFALETRSLLP